MGVNYGISVDLSGLFAANSELANQIFPRISQAIRAVVHEGEFRWKDAVSKARMAPYEKNLYIASIKSSIDPSGFSGEIRATYKFAGEIETGRPSRDLKKMLLTSTKTRFIKNGTNQGQRYLIIPFRHNVPTESGEGAHAPQMPPHVYAAAKRLSASKVLSAGSVLPSTRISASGHAVAQHSYSWGGRLPAGFVPKLRTHHVTDPYAGMVRFSTPTPGQNGKPPTRSSSYMTFRVMREGSSGWITKPQPGQYLAKKVSDGLQPILEEFAGKAVTLGMLSR